MILYDFCLLPAQFCYIIIYIWNVDIHVQIADRCAPWKISNGAENLVLLSAAILKCWCLLSSAQSLHCFGSDCIENTATNSSSNVACIFVA
jgi:hypothetical protein